VPDFLIPACDLQSKTMPIRAQTLDGYSPFVSGTTLVLAPGKKKRVQKSASN
jgi:hypothetical protein